MAATFDDARDVIVVGARVAGSATAMLLARAGVRVLVVDRARRGSDTVSTHALMRAGVVQLRRWGVLPAIEAAGTPAVHRTTFHYGDEPLAVDIKPRDGVDALYAPRRTVLDVQLEAAAEASGAELRFGVRLRDLVRDGDGRVTGAVIEDADGTATAIRAALVIGADGVRSTVARLVDAPATVEAGHAAGTAYGYFEGLELDGYHWHYRSGVSVGAIPTNDGAACVFVATTAARFRDEIRLDLAGGYRRLLAECSPALAARLEGRAPLDGLHAFPGVPGYLRRASGPGWALVGDAGFFRDPITAHGISDALRDAGLLARAWASRGAAGLPEYERMRDTVARPILEVSNAIASFDWDLDTVRGHHRRLSKVMSAESEMLAGLPVEPYEPAPAAA